MNSFQQFVLVIRDRSGQSARNSEEVDLNVLRTGSGAPVSGRPGSLVTSAEPSQRASAALTAAPEPHALYDASKRTLDLGLSSVLLVLSAPVLAAASALIFLTTRENPFLVQPRIGRLGREFPMLKLRTMRGPYVAPAVPDEPGAVFVAKEEDDGRVSPIGRVLRRTSIDELPQLLNVIAGQMSLVGPRPGLPAEVARYPVSWRRRLTVAPGLTGLWQVSGRSEVEARRRTALDRLYIRRRSLAFDLLLLARTVAATLSMRGAW
jgi:lipopolysaccharide/colanic/teichoic acid biosynthesis glycosyltransferase